MIRKQRYRFEDPTSGTGPAKHGIHQWFAAAIAAGVGAAGSIASAAMSSGAAGDAAGTQNQYAQLGIDELRNALGPSIDRLDQEQAWSDRFLGRQFQKGMRETGPYANAGRAGLGRLNYLLGTDNGLGAQPTAPTKPKRPANLKPPVYDKDPAKAAAQRAQYNKAVVEQKSTWQKSLRDYQAANTKFQTDSAAWQAGTAAAGSDPTYGSLMKPYDDKFDPLIQEVAKRGYNDKYGQEILDTARDKFDAADFQADPGYKFRVSEGSRGVEQSAAAHGSLQSGAALKELTRFKENEASNEFDRAHGRWADQRNAHLAGVTGQQAQDYRVFGDQKSTELNSLVDRRNFGFGKFGDNRTFQLGALQNMVGVGQDATDDRNHLREYFGGQRTGNRLATANQIGNWRNGNAAAIAEFLSQQGNAQAAGQVGSANAWSQGLQGIGNLAGYYYGINQLDKRNNNLPNFSNVQGGSSSTA